MAENPEVVSFDVLIDGFAEGLGRFRAAALLQDPLVAFRALFETLAWTYTIDEKMREPEGQVRDQPELRGLRYARHCVHHKWADALWLDQSGFTFPMRFPLVFFEWRWRAELPPPRQRADEDAYKEHLAGQSARVTLDRLLEYLRTLPST